MLRKPSFSAKVKAEWEYCSNATSVLPEFACANSGLVVAARPCAACGVREVLAGSEGWSWLAQREVPCCTHASVQCSFSRGG
ncbi:MAG: hypothetical protein Ta2A_20420 [Treponemataceae bacterium]|nr:MAG: hypothetical protein Ta2A_20420 [Treponemataceae bacterium]